MGMVERLGGRASLLKTLACLCTDAERRTDGATRPRLSAALSLLGCAAREAPMNARCLLIALALACAGIAPAAAQEQQPAQPAPAAEAATPPAENATTAALRDVYQALFFDTGMFDAIVVQMLPEYRRQAASSTYYRRANAERRRALDQLIEATPNILREEIVAESAIMARNATPRVAELMTPEEVTWFANFLRAPEWRPIVQRMVGQTSKNDTSELTEEELASFARFEESPMAEMLAEKGEPFMNLLTQEMDSAMQRIEPRLQMRLMTGICEALGRSCPRELRNRIRDT
jgi:hypothetical protein